MPIPASVPPNTRPPTGARPEATPGPRRERAACFGRYQECTDLAADIDTWQRNVPSFVFGGRPAVPNRSSKLVHPGMTLCAWPDSSRGECLFPIIFSEFCVIGPPGCECAAGGALNPKPRERSSGGRTPNSPALAEGLDNIQGGEKRRGRWFRYNIINTSTYFACPYPTDAGQERRLIFENSNVGPAAPITSKQHPEIELQLPNRVEHQYQPAVIPRFRL